MKLDALSVRRIRSSEGTWVFTPMPPMRNLNGSLTPNPAVLVRTPEGRTVDLYLPGGIDRVDVPDAKLLERAREVAFGRKLDWARD